MYADLHTHTIYSDGNSELKEILALACEKGIKKLALTDHDTFFHINEAKKLAKDLDIEVIQGVEMSCYDFDVNRKVHIVGLFLNENSSEVERLCSNTLEKRDEYHKILIQKMCDLGYQITYEDAKKYSPYNIVFKMHIFMAIMEKYQSEIHASSFYRTHFAQETSIEVDRQMGYIDIQEGIQAINHDGGIAILAHPSEYGNFDEVEKYVGYGLKGIEISHPAMQQESSERAINYAQTFNLMMSGGSDYHGGRGIDMGFELGSYGLNEEQYNMLKEKC